MLVIAFVAFLILLVAWLAAPNGEVREVASAPASAPNLREPVRA